MLSGPPAGDKVKFRLDGFYRHGDDAQENTDGRGMNFDRTVDLRGRVIIDLARLLRTRGRRGRAARLLPGNGR